MLLRSSLVTWLPVLGLAFGLGCSTSVDDPGSAPSAPPAKAPDSAPSCTPFAPATLLSLNALGAPSVALSDTHLGFGYVDETSIPTVASVDLASREGTTHGWSRAVATGEGSLGLRTSLAFHESRFGFAWTSARTSDRSGVRFATLVPEDGSASEAELASPDSGRYARSTDPVTAGYPGVSPAPGGFFVAWTDTRTAEPAQQGVNIAGWTGIYGRTFDASGSPVGDDVQIEQSFLPGSYAGVTAGDRFSFLFSDATRSEKGVDFFVRQGAPSTFTPAAPPPALFRLPGLDPGVRAGAVMAAGADGRVLIVAGARGETRAYAGSLLLGTNGKAEAPYAAWPNEDFAPVAIAAGPSGYVVASYDFVEAGKPEVKAIQLLFLDANGAKTGESSVALPSSDRSASGIALRATAQGTFVAVVRSPGRLEARANPYDVVLAKVCPSK